MKIKEKEAVSPVIGVILMVAITVVLAAIVYLWVAGFLGGGKSTPVTSLTNIGLHDNYYCVKVASTSMPCSADAYEITIVRGGSSLTSQKVANIYSKNVTGITFFDANYNGYLDGGDTFRLYKGTGTGAYKEGDTIMLVYLPTGSHSGSIGLVG
jgi:flagellin-like protein